MEPKTATVTDIATTVAAPAPAVAPAPVIKPRKPVVPWGDYKLPRAAELAPPARGTVKAARKLGLIKPARKRKPKASPPKPRCTICGLPKGRQNPDVMRGLATSCSLGPWK